jgi:DNA helicase-2/ATP-dependent DNA helicase PcrA
MDILEGLNPEQREAVLHDEGPMLVIAGAGTGKTQVITRRIAYLLQQKKARPSEVLALTFTEKAAREMQERLYDLIGWESFQVPVLTFHAFGAELLGRFAMHIGRSVRGGLINDVQKALLLKQHLGRIALEYYPSQTDIYEFLEGVVDYIGQLQNAGVSAARYSEYVAALTTNSSDLHPADVAEQADLARLYTLYESVKAETGVYDYNDQLYLPLQILQQHSNLAARLAREFRYVLVDEYQDTNAVQDGLLRTFVGRGGNIFAVGDDDQAIYGFRGAEIGNILGFQEHFDLGKPAVLVRNYRSGQAVLDAAYRLIQHNNPARLEERLGVNKRLVALHNDSLVEFAPYADAAAEQEGVVAAIRKRVAGGEAPGSIAVLAATHAPLRALAKVLARHNLPYAISTTANVFEQPELLSLWYLLKWLVWQASDEAIAHVMMGPFVGWRAEDLRRVMDAARDQLVPLEDALRGDEAEQSQELVRALDEWRGWAAEVPVSRLAFRLFFDTGLAERLQLRAQDGIQTRRVQRVFEDLGRLLEQMQGFEATALSPYLAAYLEDFPKPPVIEVAEPVGDAGGVQLLTVHAAKGLEFETVYLIGATQRSWSGARSALGQKLPDGLVAGTDLPPDHEQRRLMYVAVTRAKRHLIISAPVATASGAKQQVSAFVQEIFGVDEIQKRVALVGAEASETLKVLDKIQHFYPISDQYQSKKLPFETEDGWLELSVTALGGYDFCPFEFYIQQVLRIAQPMGPQLAFGSVLHRAFELYYRAQLAGEMADPAELHLALDEAWSTRGYTDRLAAEADLSLAHATLDQFLRREPATGRRIIGSEVPIRFEIPEAKLRLRGKIDALFETAEGVQIRDFKTGRGKTDAEKLSKQAKDNFQLRTYALAYEQLRGSALSEVVLDYVVTMVEGQAVLTDTILRNHRTKLAAMADLIRTRQFAPNPSALHTCAAIRYYGTGEQDELREQQSEVV